MVNAKNEFLSRIKLLSSIRCAEIYCEGYGNKKDVSVKLRENYTPEEFESFLNALDFEYDDGYGIQEVTGTVWMSDGTWYKREEYDGSEWWEYYSYPEIPDYLKGE